MELEIPQDFSSLTVSARAEFRTKAKAAYAALTASKKPEEMTDAEVAYASSLANGVKASMDADTAASAAASARAAQIEAAAGIMTASTETPEPPAQPTDPTPATDPAPAADPADPAPSTDPAPAGDPAPAEPVTASAPVVNITLPDNFSQGIADAVVNAITTTPRGNNVARVAAGRSGQPITPNQRNRAGGGAMMVASRDVIGTPAGSQYTDMLDVAKAFSEIASRFPKSGHAPNVFDPHPTATFSRGIDAFDGFHTGNPDFEDGQELIDAVSKQTRLPGGSLVAAGGWCAPSETLYDLCANESLDGLVSLPEIQVNRGGIRFTTGPDFSTIYASAGFCQTEAEAIAGTTKPCVEVPCPDFEEVRLDACGLCVRAPILTNVGYPELVRRWIDGTFVAHRHKVNARSITAMATALAAAAQTVTGLGSAAADTLNALELAAEGVRWKYRMRFQETLEVILPHWMLAVIRADLALRNGRTESEEVSDEQVTAYFTRRNLAVQWVYDWQDLVYPDTDPGAPVVPGCVIDYPATVEALIYPAGTFVRGTNDIINLSTVYDTQNLQLNMYTAAFFEEGILIAQVCFSGCRLSIPLCVSGKTGAPNIDACPAA